MFNSVRPVLSSAQVQAEAVLVNVPMVVLPMVQYNRPPPFEVAVQLLKLNEQPVTSTPLTPVSVVIRLQLLTVMVLNTVQVLAWANVVSAKSAMARQFFFMFFYWWLRNYFRFPAQ